MPSPRRLSLLFPVRGRHTFLERHWPHRPASHHGDVERFGELGELGDLGALLTLAMRSRMQIKAMVQGLSGTPSETAIQPDELLSMYVAGATIACSELHRWHRGISDWVDGLREELGVPDPIGGCNLYLTPPGHGVPMHFDDHEVIVVQLSGRKRWSIAPNAAVRHPLHNAGRTLEGEVGRYAEAAAPANLRGARVIAMRPGSVLFLPRGYWHETDARERSISLTFGFRTPSWLDLLQQHLRSNLMLRPEWREPAWQAWTDSASRGAAIDRWELLRTALVRGLADTPLDALAPVIPDRARHTPRTARRRR